MSLVSSKLSKHSSSSSVRSRRAKAAAKAACLQVEMDFLEREAEYKKLVMQKELAKARAEEETMCKIEEERQATEPQKRIGLRNSWTTYNNHESINQSMQVSCMLENGTSHASLQKGRRTMQNKLSACDCLTSYQ